MAYVTMKSMRLLLALTVIAMVSTLRYVSAQQGVSFIITEDIFNQFLKHRNDGACAAKGFYTYASFIAAASRFPSFGNVGNLETRKRELAAFFAQTSHETSGGWDTAPDGPYAWGYCFKEEQDADSDDMYFGRGPVQLKGQKNYEAAGTALGYDLLNNPDMVSSNPTVSFKTAVWFWMTAKSPKPSSHTVMIGKWVPSGGDTAAGRVAGYGLVTNIMNGGVECGRGSDSNQEDRIGFYKAFCDVLGASYGPNVDCNTQRSFGA